MPGGWQKTSPRQSPANTPRLRAWRAAVLQRDNHTCQLRYENCETLATQADHRVEVADGGAPYDPDNGQAVCRTCHTTKTTQHANAKRWSIREKREQENHPGLTK